MPKLTVITVVFNDKKHIEKTIKSVLNQTFKDIEYWIIDGASTDGTLEIIKKYDTQLNYLSEPDRGIYDAMNKGLERATGQYVIFLNSGDEFYDNQVLERVFSLPEADVYYGDSVIVDEQGEVLGLRRLRPPRQLTWKSLAKGMLVLHQAFIARRELCPHYDLKYKHAADFDWVIKVLKQSKKIVNTNMILVKFLAGGHSSKHIAASLKERFDILRRHYGLPTAIWTTLYGFVRGFWFWLWHKRL